MIAIVNIDENWGIGKEGRLQAHISSDLQRFKKMTTGKVIIYGKNTLYTFPRQKPLPQRKNIILSRDKSLLLEEATVCHSVPALLQYIEALKQEQGYQDDDFIVVGGASVYEQLIGYCSDCQITRMHFTFPADCYFPVLDRLPEWRMIWQSAEQYDEKNAIPYVYQHYHRCVGSIVPPLSEQDEMDE